MQTVQELHSLTLSRALFPTDPAQGIYMAVIFGLVAAPIK
jgi:hypothetical protein